MSGTRWSLAQALKVAERRRRALQPGLVAIEPPKNRGGRPPRDPAARARLEAGRRALAQVTLVTALIHGTSLRDLERLVACSGVVADLFRRRWVIEELADGISGATPRKGVANSSSAGWRTTWKTTYVENYLVDRQVEGGLGGLRARPAKPPRCRRPHHFSTDVPLEAFIGDEPCVRPEHPAVRLLPQPAPLDALQLARVEHPEHVASVQSEGVGDIGDGPEQSVSASGRDRV
ncbi:MAG: hypothetical protein ACREM3_28615 [Candidatus Rokuibacteriota bacterium]